MDDFYSRTGERYSIKSDDVRLKTPTYEISHLKNSPYQEESWVVWVGGSMIGIALATLLVLCL